jgi:high-affinity iron transporter
MPFLSSALQSGAILLREGLEALLIIATLAAFLRKAGAEREVRALFLGAGAAVLLSLVGAFVMLVFLGGAHNDLVEAVIMAVAAALMLYMSGWLFLKQDPRAWMAELKASAGDAVSRGAAWPLGLIAFFAVFREGAETVLFLHALASTEGGWNLGLVLGLVGAVALLVLIFHSMQWLAGRVPLRPVFVLTSAFLFVMALRFMGAAIQELQEQEIVSVTPANAISDLLVPLGFNASWEAAAAYLAVIALAAASLFALRPGKAVEAERPMAAQPAE